MSESRSAGLRVALVDLELGDCDRLRAALGGEAEVALVVGPTADSDLARWAELAGYPYATGLSELGASVVDGIVVGAASPRRQDVLSLAGLLHARAAVLGDSPPAPSDPPPSSSPIEGPVLVAAGRRRPKASIDAALHALFGTQEGAT